MPQVTLDGHPRLFQALWAAISKPGESGTKEDPITAARGMEYVWKILSRSGGQQAVPVQADREAEGGKIVLQYLPTS